jgi:hypothetical protein
VVGVREGGRGRQQRRTAEGARRPPLHPRVLPGARRQLPWSAPRSALLEAADATKAALMYSGAAAGPLIRTLAAAVFLQFPVDSSRLLGRQLHQLHRTSVPELQADGDDRHLPAGMTSCLSHLRLCSVSLPSLRPLFLSLSTMGWTARGGEAVAGGAVQWEERANLLCPDVIARPWAAPLRPPARQKEHERTAPETAQRRPAISRGG